MNNSGVSCSVCDSISNAGFVNVSLHFLGLVAIVAATGYLAIQLKKSGLENHNYALGLPPGSVRALIALGLLFAFITTGLSLYHSIPVGMPERLIEGLSEKPTDLPPNAFAVEKRVGENSIYEVWVTADPDFQQQFAMSILTVVSTALTTLTGFYFGNRAAANQSDEDE